MMIACFKVLNKWLNGRLIFLFHFVIFFKLFDRTVCMLYIIYNVYL